LSSQGNVIQCAISTAAIDDLEGRRGVNPEERVDQFMRLREVIEERASRKFFEEGFEADRPVVLRSLMIYHDGRRLAPFSGVEDGCCGERAPERPRSRMRSKPW
jgi:Protein of unknown function (DUF1488)